MFGLFTKRLSKRDRRELQFLQQTENFFTAAATLVDKNTALVPKGKAFASQLQATVKLIQRRKQEYLTAVLARMGIPQATVNIFTGVIKPVAHVSTDHREAASE